MKIEFNEIMSSKNESLGIPNYGPWYIKSKNNAIEDMFQIEDFIKKVISKNDIEIFKGYKRFDFINYGSTQLVFVLHVDDKKYTLLVSQPATKYGVGKTEFLNLVRLNELNPDTVIKPISYFSDNPNELYVTPYVYQARCVGVNTTKWGVWLPDPEYHFEDFTKKELSNICTVMVALLIKYYDDNSNEGLSKIRLDGGDFMLDKEIDEDGYNIDSILKHIKLIAARDKIHLSLDEYIEALKQELTNNVEKPRIIGKKLRCPINLEDIEKGIKLGLNLRNRKDKILTFTK